jgi:hypothetical protein
MDYDIESFFAGLQTGLRLGRVPFEKTPVPPSNSYIVTEQDDDIITEGGDNIVTE